MFSLPLTSPDRFCFSSVVSPILIVSHTRNIKVQFPSLPPSLSPSDRLLSLVESSTNVPGIHLLSISTIISWLDHCRNALSCILAFSVALTLLPQESCPQANLSTWLPCSNRCLLPADFHLNYWTCPHKIFLSLVPKCSSSVLSHHLPSEDLLSSHTEFPAVHQTYRGHTWLGAPPHVAPSRFSWPTDQEDTSWSFKAQIKYHLREAFWDFPKSSSHLTPLSVFSCFVHSTGSLFSKTVSSGVRLPGFESLAPTVTNHPVRSSYSDTLRYCFLLYKRERW